MINEKEMENIQEQINQKQADILSAKAYLYETDYEVIKSYERKYPINESLIQKRQEVRDLINIREDEIKVLQLELNSQEEVGIDPIPY